MATAWVYGPFNHALNWGQRCYCEILPPCPYGSCSENSNLCEHYVIHDSYQPSWDLPMDFGDIVGPTEVHCQVSSAIQSIYVEHDDNMCGDTSNPATYGILCHLYINSDGTGYVGTMMYGHINPNNRIGEGLKDRSHPNFNSGGWIIGYPQPLCNYCGTDCDCGCAQGVHIHAQARYADTWYRYGCDEDIYRSTAIWGFNY